MVKNKFLTAMPNIQTTGISYASLMTEMQNMIRNNPKWNENWSTFIASEAGTIFSEFMAFIADNLGLKIDSSINEMFVSTTSQDRSKIRLLNLINYMPRLSNAAEAYVTIESDIYTNNEIVVYTAKADAVTYGSRINEIAYIESRGSDDSIIRWELLPLDINGKPEYTLGISLPANNNSVVYETLVNSSPIILLQGRTKYTEFNSTETNGTNFTILDNNIVENSIRIYDINSGLEHTRIDNFTQLDEIENMKTVPFTVRMNDEGFLIINYAPEYLIEDKNKRYNGATIGVFYRVCDGELGNIPTGYIDAQLRGSTVQDRLAIKLNVTNKNPSYKGSSQETLDDALLYGPLSLKTMNRAVTAEDYDIFINNYSGTKILKNKTYTISNMPTNFKNIFGRYINPQEVFSIIIPNKNYDAIPPSRYNDYPWIYLNKSNVFNELYTFDNINYNQLATRSADISELLVRTADSIAPQLYRNCIVLNIGQEFNSWVYTGNLIDGVEELNDSLQLKLNRNMISQVKFFRDIPFNFLYDGEEDNGEEYILDFNNTPKIERKVNAKFLSNVAYEKRKKGEIGEPINISGSLYLLVNIDDRRTIEVNLRDPKNDGGQGMNFPNMPYYIYLSNPEEPTEPEDIDPNEPYREKSLSSTWAEGNENDAAYRYGIVELINDQLLSLVDINGTNYDNIYKAFYSYQMVGINKASRLAQVVSGLDDSNASIQVVMGIKTGDISNPTEIYRITIGAAGTENTDYITEIVNHYSQNEPGRLALEGLDTSILYSGANRNSLLTIALYLDYVFSDKSTLTMQQFLPDCVSRWDSVANEFVQIWDTSELPKIRVDCVRNNQFATDSDVVYTDTGDEIIYGRDNTDINYFNYDIMFYTTDDSGLCIDGSDKFIYIDKDVNIPGVNSLLRVLKGIDETDDVNLPKYSMAANYNNLASVVEREEYVIGRGYVINQYLQIRSPLTGEESTIYFERDINQNTTADFMEKFMGVNYSNRTAGDAINDRFSDKAYGIKRLHLIKKESPAGFVTYGNGDIANFGISAGNVIYEHNCVNVGNDFPVIYSAYRATIENNDVVIGSNYNNFYYGNDTEINKNFIPPIVGIEGQYITENTTDTTRPRYIIDVNKSNFNIKFTTEPVNTSSIYSIVQDLDILPVGNVEVATAQIGNDISYGVSRFNFTIDGVEYTLNPTTNPQTDGFTNFRSFYEALRNKILNGGNPEHIKNIDQIIRINNNLSNSIIFSNVKKQLLPVDDDEFDTTSGFIRFSYTSAGSNATFFEKLFGTSATNAELYSLYPEDAFENNKVIKPDGTFYYAPINQATPLTFTYRKKIGNVSRTPDFYFNSVFTTDANNKPIQQITMRKISSNFQDLPFYLHFVNDRTYEMDSTQSNFVNIEEDYYQEYLTKYKMFGTNITFVQPYFKTFDIDATIEYSRNYSLAEITDKINKMIARNYSLGTFEIGQKITRARIFKDIMGIAGVENCTITYLGTNLSDVTNNPNGEEISSDFYEIISLHEAAYDNNNEQNRGAVFTYIPYEE